jgi:hypothetical protein
MRLSAKEEKAIKRLAETVLGHHGGVVKGIDLKTAILHVRQLLSIGEVERAENWHRKYTYVFSKQCGVDFPPLGKDLRWYTSRLSALKHGRRAQISTVSGAVEVVSGKWRPVLGGRVASASSPFSISVHISPAARPEGRKVPHN